jgi:NADH-quinone oxidoreductase subunit E
VSSTEPLRVGPPPSRPAPDPAGPRHLSEETWARARELVALYPEPRSALIPLCHLAQEDDGWLTPGAMEDVAALVGVTPAEVFGTATFYDMLHTAPVGTYLVSVCTNIACLLDGAAELLEHAEGSLGVKAGGTTLDGVITLEEAECLADCDRAPCVQVNHRFVGAQTAESFDALVAELRAGGRPGEIPAHGMLNRVRREVGLTADPAKVAAERAAMAEAQAQRAAHASSESATSGGGGS